MPPASSPGIIRSDIDVLDRFAAGLCSSSAFSFLLSSPKKRCHDSLNGLNVCMFLSLRCLTMSLGTAYLFTAEDGHQVHAYRYPPRNPDVVAPEPRWQEAYAELHVRYRALYPALRDVRVAP